MNSLIKRYISSKSEISDFIRFLRDFEKRSAIGDMKVAKDVANQYEHHPIMQDLKKKVSGIIYTQHFYQFTLNHNYFCKIQNDGAQEISFEVSSNLAKDITKFREVKVSSDKYCSHSINSQFGLIFRNFVRKT